MLYSYSPQDDIFHFGGKCIKLRKKTTQQLQQVPETDQTDQAPLPYTCINRRNSSESMLSDKPGCTAGKDTLPTLSAACKMCSELQASNLCKKSPMLRWTFGELSLNHSCSCKWPPKNSLTHQAGLWRYFTFGTLYGSEKMFISRIVPGITQAAEQRFSLASTHTNKFSSAKTRRGRRNKGRKTSFQPH